jgi:hypothetical protein
MAEGMMVDEDRWCALFFFFFLLVLGWPTASQKTSRYTVLTALRSLYTPNIIWHITIAPLAICER